MTSKGQSASAAASWNRKNSQLNPFFIRIIGLWRVLTLRMERLATFHRAYPAIQGTGSCKRYQNR